MAKKTHLTASRLRTILVATLIGVILLTGGLFYVSHKQLSTIASSVGQSLSDANASQNNLATLKQIEKELADNSTTVQRASKVVADSNQYNYQNIIVRDLNMYAQRSGLTITNIDFGSSQTGAASAAPAPAAAATPGATTTPAAESTGGLSTTQVVISLKTPIPYENLLHFLRALELNLTKMQVASIKLSKASEDPKSVSIDSLTIEIHTKQ
jgi:hypothetical protein